jgi:membrane-associated phospholipid phosphatase
MFKLLTTACALVVSATALHAQDVAFSEPVDLVVAGKPGPDIDAATSQLESRYKLHYKIDIPLTAVGTIWTLYAFGKVYDKPKSDVATIAALNKDDINGIDRWAAGMHDQKASATSDYFFYGSVPLPFLLLLDKKVRRDAPKVGFLYLEAMAVTGLLYTGTNYFVDRYRPETYRTDRPPVEQQNGNYKNSFFAGHVALVGTATFFTAKIYNDYHPNNNFKYLFWGGAIVATGTTAYLRHKAGKHFPTDIAVGTAVGVLSGVLIPELHKNRKFSDRGLGLSPAMIGDKPGVSLTYRFK